MKKVRDFDSEELAAWQEDYPRREELRSNIESAVGKYGPLAEIKPRILDTIIQEALGRSDIFGKEIVADEYRSAQIFKKDIRKAKNNIKLGILDPSKIVTPGQTEEWGNAYRVHPQVRETYLEEAHEGKRTIFIANDRNGEPAGIVSLIHNGPIAHIDENFPQSDELGGKPDEYDVIHELGGMVPWVEDLKVMEGFRRRGVGRRLMQRIEQSVWESEALPKRLALAVRPDNDKALMMYEQLGYKITWVAGQVTFVYHLQAAPPHEALLMTKGLRQRA